MKRLVWLTVPLALGLWACQKKDEAKTEDKTPAAPVELTDEALDQADIPVKEDFEEEAEKAIDEDNLESQIDALEKEIQGDAE